MLGWFIYTQLRGNKEQQRAAARLAEQINEVFPVEVAITDSLPISSDFYAFGQLMPDEITYLIANTQGKVEEVYVEKGDFVRQEQLMAKVEDDALQTRLALAEANLEKLQADKRRFENLLEGEAITQRQYEEIVLGIKNAETNIQLLRENIENTRIKAPMAGTISNLFLQEGLFIGGGARLAEIVDLRKMKLMVRVSEEVLLRLNKGQQVNIEIDLLEDHRFEGRIKHLAVTEDRGGKYQVEIEIRDKLNQQLKPGMFATAHFQEPERRSLVIPRKALLGSIQAAEVFVLMEKDTAVRRVSFKPGVYNSDWIEVREGLDNGTAVVVNGQINLTNGTRVSVQDTVETKTGGSR